MDLFVYILSVLYRDWGSRGQQGHLEDPCPLRGHRERLGVGRVRSREVLAAEVRPSCANSGAQIGQRWEGGGGGTGVSVEDKAACLQ